MGALWRILAIYRIREGLCEAEFLDIHKAFERCDKDSAGWLGIADIGKVMRHLGYQASFEVQQQLMAKVDLDHSGRLDQLRFRKMARMIREKEMALMREAFLLQDAELEGSIAKAKAMEALESLPCIEMSRLRVQIMTDELMDDKEGHINLQGFLAAGIRSAKEARQAFCKNGGFTSCEVMQFEQCFRQYDKDGSGDITSKELISLIEDIFPEMACDRSMRPELARRLQEVDLDGSGTLDFGDFLRMMSQCRELQEKARANKERMAVEDTGFTPQEVTEFRELFMATDEGRGELSFEDLRRMIHMITPLGDQLVAELFSRFQEATGRQIGVEGDRSQADFPEFLWLMRKLLDTNFANIKEKTSGCAHSPQPSPTRRGGGGNELRQR